MIIILALHIQNEGIVQCTGSDKAIFLCVCNYLLVNPHTCHFGECFLKAALVLFGYGLFTRVCVPDATELYLERLPVLVLISPFLFDILHLISIVQYALLEDPLSIYAHDKTYTKRQYVVSLTRSACLRGHFNLYNIIFEHRLLTPAALADAAVNGDVELVEYLISKHVDVNSKFGAEQWTALHYATGNGYVGIVKLLLSHGAEANAKLSPNHCTPLHLLVRKNQVSCVELLRLLITHGADTNARTSDGATPLCIASLWRNVEAVELLVDNGADVNATASCGCTPLMYAIAGGSKLVVGSLIDENADKTIKNHFNDNAFRLAAYQRDRSIIGLLYGKTRRDRPIHSSNRPTAFYSVSADATWLTIAFDQYCFYLLIVFITMHNMRFRRSYTILRVLVFFIYAYAMFHWYQNVSFSFSYISEMMKTRQAIGEIERLAFLAINFICWRNAYLFVQSFVTLCKA